jgi:hypothetical protein
LPTYTIKAPNGRTYSIQGPAGATDAQVRAKVLEQYPEAGKPAGGPTGYDAALSDARKRAGATPGLVRSFTQGVGYNFTDDIDANLAAAETAVNNALGGGLFGKKSYTPQQARTAVLQAEREAATDYARRNPGMSAMGTVAGALLSPVNKVVAPVATAARLGKAAPAVAGALAGGVAGAGDDGASGAFKGALAGAAFGQALPMAFNAGMRVAAPAVQRAVNALPANVRNAMDAGVNAAAQNRAARLNLPPPPPRPAVTPPAGTQAEIKTARALQNAIDRDAAAGVAFRPGANPLYEGGENLAGVYEAAANFPGQARQQILEAAKRNRKEASQGIVDDIANVLGGKGDFFAYQKGLADTQRRNAQAGMEKIGDQLVTLDPDAILALRSDKARAALTNAADNMRASTDPNVRSQANDLLNVLDQVFDKPSGVTLRVRDAQTISEKLLGAGDTAWRAGDGDTGQALSGLGRAIRGNARDPNRGGFSEYDDWLKQYGTDAQNKKALELGRDVLRSNVWPEEIGSQLAEMGPGSLIHYQKGVAETLLNKVQEAGGDMRVMRQLLDNKNLGAKIRTAFPDDASFAAFLQSAERRVQDANRNAGFTANSATARRMAAQQDLEDQPSVVANAVDQALDAISNPTGVPSKVARATMSNLGMFSPTKGVLKDPEANALLGRTALDPDEVTRLLNMLQTVRGAQARTAQATNRAGARAVTAAAPLIVR